MLRDGTYYERCDVRPEIECYLRKDVEYNETRAADVEELSPCASSNDEEKEQH